MKKGALATGALALGSSAVDTAAAQETPDDAGQTPDEGGQGADHVLLLHPDAVENAEFTVVSAELDWNPIGAGDAGTPMETPSPGGDETPEEETPEAGQITTPDGEAQEYRTHVIQYGFSPSHVALAFVPQDADVEENGDYQLGEIEEIVRQPGQGGSGILQGDPTYVRVALQGGTDDGADAGTPADTPEDTPAATPEDTPEETPGGTPTEEEDDGGIFG